MDPATLNFLLATVLPAVVTFLVGHFHIVLPAPKPAPGPVVPVPAPVNPASPQIRPIGQGGIIDILSLVLSSVLTQVPAPQQPAAIQKVAELSAILTAK